MSRYIITNYISLVRICFKTEVEVPMEQLWILGI